MYSIWIYEYWVWIERKICARSHFVPKCVQLSTSTATRWIAILSPFTMEENVKGQIQRKIQRKRRRQRQIQRQWKRHLENTLKELPQTLDQRRKWQWQWQIHLERRIYMITFLTNENNNHNIHNDPSIKRDRGQHLQFLRCLSSLSSFIRRVLGHCCWRILVEFLVSLVGEFV